MRYGGFLLLVLVVFTVARYWAWIALTAAVIVLLVVAWKMTGWLGRVLERLERERAARRCARRAKREALARRADEQNRLFLACDDRGVYGEYPPHQDFSPETTTRRVERR